MPKPRHAPLSDRLLELFFDQSLEGFFFMMLDKPVQWDDGVDKEKVLDYVFAHQRITKVNDAMLAQYGATRDQFIGLTPTDFYEHDIAYGRSVWREFFDAGRLHVETEERKIDGTPIWIEGDYICFHDQEGRITGHFGIQREITARKKSEQALQQFNKRLQVLQEIDRAILAADSPAAIADAAMRHIRELITCVRASVTVFDFERHKAVLLAIHSEKKSDIGPGKELSLDTFGDLELLRAGEPHIVEDIRKSPGHPQIRSVQAEGVESYINVPMRARDELIGSLNIGADAEGVLSSAHIEIAREIANNLAVAIGQARLNEQVERHAAELEVRVAERTAELEESELRYRSLYNLTPVLMHALDRDAKLIAVNQHWLEVLGYEENEVIGRKVKEFQTAASGQYAIDYHFRERFLETGIAKDLELQFIKKNGEIIDVLLSAHGEFDDDGELLHTRSFMVDITDRKRAETLQIQNTYLREELRTRHNFGEIVGEAEAMQEVFRSIELVAGTESTVLLLGETGTGKELIARAIHNASTRKDNVMVKVNCGALPSGLVESELFGHERGAFTGATAEKKGRFELANNGTLFLDEVGELSHDIQVKLLRALQEQEFERVGGSKTVKVDVRVIAATNRNLADEVKRGTFRADLYYRLNIFPVHLPPLRERKSDIPLLANYFIAEFSQRVGKRITGVNKQALAKLLRYDWPGNVRELANILERAVILCRGRVLQDEQISSLGENAPASEKFYSMEEAERMHILEALKKTGGVLAGPKGAAALLGVNRSTLWSRMRKLGLDPQDGSTA